MSRIIFPPRDPEPPEFEEDDAVGCMALLLCLGLLMMMCLAEACL